MDECLVAEEEFCALRYVILEALELTACYWLGCFAIVNELVYLLGYLLKFCVDFSDHLQNFMLDQVPDLNKEPLWVDVI